jgi:4-hydroxy-3-polyprenylbenzoate decarboxylase
MWAVSTQMDFTRDILHCSNTPIDYLDFASEKLELGAKIGFDATKKVFPETGNVWGRKIIPDDQIIAQTLGKMRFTAIGKFFPQ